ncbi:putative flavoprotein involved in K+ transport [Rivularia sp. PCC 7116]|uniref:flavin-containing monooxygenase n=1 Tax=Rivularia sp. PCC 7116 TaxID=373994 RepID=UPI00029EF4A2|nr:NAD(P)-binding domain-containing protein [Rivularia sp. PCC 7116]AFY58774.1 putative flavoprotein involved in K+ transport [Rivularia sp. PCC 7116]
MQAKNICVIGAGVSGLVTAKTFLEEGYKVTVFEKQKGLGGVWDKSRAYPGLSIQNPKDTYAFSDYPMPSSYPEWPSGEQICDYLESYARHFGVLEKIHFGTEVIRVEQRNPELLKWNVSVNFHDASNDKPINKNYEFDFVIVCNGIFGIPNMPSFPRMKEFTATGGKILHSSEFKHSSELEGKKVVIVGFGKSATDIATVAATKAQECTLIFRQALWKIPKFFLGIINVKYILLTRFAESWMPYRNLKGWENLLHTIGKPLVWFFWRINETILRLQFPLDACDLTPDQPMNKLIGCSIGLVPKGFYEYFQNGKIRAEKTKVKNFYPQGIVLENGKSLEADIVIFATGFRQGMPFLEEKYRQEVFDNQGIIHLYRHLIHPNIPRMGFVGYNYSGCAQLSSEIGARWLAQYFKDKVNLPSPQEMLEDIKAELEWRLKNRPYAFVNGACVTPFTFHYIDELMEDMGLKKSRKALPILELMTPADPSAYKNVRQEIQANNYSEMNN